MQNTAKIIFEVPDGYAGGTLSIEMPTRVKVTYSNGQTATRRLRGGKPVTAKVSIEWPS